jgi:hypothetical protein
MVDWDSGSCVNCGTTLWGARFVCSSDCTVELINKQRTGIRRTTQRGRRLIQEVQDASQGTYYRGLTFADTHKANDFDLTAPAPNLQHFESWEAAEAWITARHDD